MKRGSRTSFLPPSSGYCNPRWAGSVRATARSLLIQGTGAPGRCPEVRPPPNCPSPGPLPLRPPGKGKFDIFKSRALEGSMRPGGPTRVDIPDWEAASARSGVNHANWERELRAAAASRARGGRQGPGLGAGGGTPGNGRTVLETRTPARPEPPSFPAQLCRLCGPAPVSLQRPLPSVAPGAAREAGAGASHAAAPPWPLPRGLGFGGGCHEADRPAGPGRGGWRGESLEVVGAEGGRLARSGSPWARNRYLWN